MKISPRIMDLPRAPVEKPKPKLDPAARQLLAKMPAQIYMVAANIQQDRTAEIVQKALLVNGSFIMVKRILGGGMHLSRTVISYRADLDRARAETLAQIVRDAGVPSAYAEQSGDGSGDPGVLQIFFGADAQR